VGRLIAQCRCGGEAVRVGDAGGGESGIFSRRAARSIAKFAGKHGEPLSPEDWEAYFRFGAQPSSRVVKRLLHALPAEPRCGFCGAPFTGMGARLVRPLGFRPSRKNPSVCAACVESAPPGGVTTEAGVLFADVRGFTALSEKMSPAESSAMLRRFYAHAASVFFPEALIDKLIGDEVMALYIPLFMRPGRTETTDDDRSFAANVMLRHARELLERVGYGRNGAPEVELGIGLDFGEVFVGNIGEASARDFTAIGDVVNTASRLQSHAAAGEIMLSERLGRYLDAPPGRLEDVTVKGKLDPVVAYRVRAT
jgi:adenylate cyclase